MSHPLPAGHPAKAGLASAGLARIDELLGGLTDRKELSGVVALVARDGEIVHRFCAGMKRLSSGDPMTPDAIFTIYSMTKPVTAAAMMTLWDEGRWRPEDPIAKHLPEFAGVKGPDGRAPDHPPTVGELMTHTAGFAYGLGVPPQDATDEAYAEAEIWKAADLADFARRVARIPLAYQPGTRWRYSLSMDLQGAIIERLTGETLPDYMRRRLFAPLRMDDTDFFVPAEKRGRMTTVYHRFNRPDLAELDHPGFKREGLEPPALPNGGGGLFSTADDYARFAQMLLNGGELQGARVLSADAVRLMTSNHLPDAILEGAFGVGMQTIRPGFGYGYNGAVFTDPALAGSRVGQGTYQWDGAAGTWFWIDPANRLLFVGLIQRMMDPSMVPLQATTQGLIADALI
ncbi:MAG TPA: serine hydrolase domain-containing protein [Caulobacteraceae bacterium]|jgi:CubicO group peptidase (beta-lactamase class C family)|nr:serine hydrolase domain-containing protein [Caulobacteraceae bacterium]